MKLVVMSLMIILFFIFWIDHSDNENPFQNTYYTQALNEIVRDKYNIFTYYFQYIKYESDKGLIFDRTHLYSAKSYSHSVVIRTSRGESDDNEIGAAVVEISNINFDYYNRSYSRIQTLLAELLSVIELITGIGSTVCGIALNKKMSRKVIKHILHRNNKVNIETNKGLCIIIRCNSFSLSQFNHRLFRIIIRPYFYICRF